MPDSENLIRNTERTFRLVCLNFAMLLILFIGIGYLLWQSASLVRALQVDLASARQAVRLSVSEAVARSDFGQSLADISQTVKTTADRIDGASKSIVEINKQLRAADADAIAQRVSYHILKGLGDGFTEAAESRRAPAVD